MVTGLPKFAGETVRQRGSSPKFQVINTALITAQAGLSPAEARDDHGFWGRLTESAVEAHLANAAARGECELFYWRDRSRDVDFVVRQGSRIVAIEVKSARTPAALPGLVAFAEQFHPRRTLLVGADGIGVSEFLSRPVLHWLGD